MAGLDDPLFAGREAQWPVGVHTGPMDAVLTAAERAAAPVAGLQIRRVEPGDDAAADHWAELFVAGFAIEGAIADAWRRFNRFLVRARGYQQFIASLDGRDVAASALFTRRRVAWLGAGTVLPEARGRGIQRELIADRARRAAAAGCTRVLSTAEVDTRSAANLDAHAIRRIWTRGHFRVDPAPPSGSTPRPDPPGDHAIHV